MPWRSLDEDFLLDRRSTGRLYNAWCIEFRLVLFPLGFSGSILPGRHSRASGRERDGEKVHAGGERLGYLNTNIIKIP